MSWIDFWHPLLGLVRVTFLILGLAAEISGWPGGRTVLECLGQAQGPE